MQIELPVSTHPFHGLGRLNPGPKADDGNEKEEPLKAYVLIQTEANRAPIAETLQHVPGVISAQDLTGPYDAIALAGSDSTRILTEQVVAQIQQIPGVIRALSAPLIGSIGRVVAPGPGGRIEAA